MGVLTKTKAASAYNPREARLENCIAVFFGTRSTSDPRKIPETATVNEYTPAMIEVAITDRVSRNTQNVTANHMKVLVRYAAIEFASTAWNVFIVVRYFVRGMS